MSIRRYFSGCVLASVVSIGTLSSGGCKNAAQAEAGVFSTEQIICMAIGLTSGVLSGTAEQIAAGIQQACPTILPALTQDVINFVNAFESLSPAQKAAWKDYASKHSTPAS
jgi:hypothetical protein